MTDIPEDIAKAGERAALLWLRTAPDGIHRQPLSEAIALTLFAARAAQAERMARLEDAVNFVARWAWRTDPPNANNKLSDTERLSCIKHHPTIKKAAQPHIELAESEAARALSQEGSVRAALGGNADA